MTATEKADLLRRYPAHWFVRVEKHGFAAIIAIPKRRKPPVVRGTAGLTLDMLHGATVKLHDEART